MSRTSIVPQRRLQSAALLTLALTAVLACARSSASEPGRLGEISFPNSGDAAAQEAFLEGVLLLHNFEYEDAATAFAEARTVDPDFALAYWGEAFTHNHPIWMQQDREAANAVLGQLAPTAEERQQKAPTDREKEYLLALETLLGNTEAAQGKTKQERDLLFRDAMRRLHERYPDDQEAAAFYSLSILGTAHEGRDFRTYMRAAAVAMEVWDRNRNHPGAAHYLIHSFDDPVHAPLGLPMARAYAKIAPAAAHAQHMTSHIFVALGLWDDVARANEVARDVQNRRNAAVGEPPAVCAHYPYWLEYGYLQLGRSDDAAAVLDTCAERVRQQPTRGERWHFAAMRARYTLDTREWSATERWQADLQGEGGTRDYVFTNAFAALQRGDLEAAQRDRERLASGTDGGGMGDAKRIREILIAELDGLLALRRGNDGAGLEKLGKAAELEASMPYAFGPPEVVKPAFELLGEELERLERWTEAIAALERQLERTPRRTNTLRTLARAAAAAGDATRAEEIRRDLEAIGQGGSAGAGTESP